MSRFGSLSPLFALMAVLIMAEARPLHAEVKELTKTVGGTSVSYKVVLPNGYDPSKTYPGILAFGGGPQTMNTVTNVVRNLQPEAERRGYIVIAPAAPNGELFFYGGVRIFPEFLQQILADYKIDGGKFHVIGPSNGGIAAMYVAGQFPQYFRSATAYPGYMWRSTAARLQAISGICVFMYVGENDDYRWHDEMKREVEFLRSKGTLAVYSEEKDQPHRIATLADAGAARLFENFEQARKSCVLR